MIQQWERIVLIPAYCPDERLIELVHSLYLLDFTVVVVNDGSSPEQASIFAILSDRAMIVTHEQNKGKGAALKTGLSYIRRTFVAPYVVVSADADGQHSLEDIIAVCEVAQENPGCLILGSRKIGHEAPFRSYLGNNITRWVFRLSTGVNICDTQTGLRAFSYDLTPELLSIEGDRYEYEMNVLLQFSRLKIPMKEVPIQTIYLDGNDSSHFDPLRDSIRIYKKIIKFSESSLISFLVDYILFVILMACTGMIIISNVMARIASATINFHLNRKYVFQSHVSVAMSAMKYMTLAVVVLFLNTCLLKLLTIAGIPYMLAKVFTECFLFFFSWTFQKTVVFKEAKV